MTQTSPPPVAERRKLKFNNEDEVIAEVQRLRAMPCRKLGNWTLAQMSRHLARTIEGSLVKPPMDEPTEDQLARKKGFFDMVMGPAGMPVGIPLAPEMVPPADCDQADVDRFIGALEALKGYPHRCVTVGRCGPVPVEEVRVLHNIHAAHHLSFLVPAERRMNLKYADVDAMIEDIRLLKQGYVKSGNWTMPQICWHLNTALNYFTSPPPHPDYGPVSEETKMKLCTILATGQLPGGIQSPERAVPPAACDDTDINALLATLEKYRTFAGPFAPHRIFGQLSDADGRALVLIHSAHHLSYLVPTAI